MSNKRPSVPRELALKGLETFSEFMGIELPEKAGDAKAYALLGKVIKLVMHGHLTVDEAGKATYKFQRDAPSALGTSVSFREPTGGDARTMAKGDGMHVYTYTASIINQDEELLYKCKQKDSAALTDVGLLVLGG